MALAAPWDAPAHPPHRRPAPAAPSVPVAAAGLPVPPVLPPGWRGWRGVGGLLYARRPKTSPPWVVRAATPAGLERAAWEREGRQ